MQHNKLSLVIRLCLACVGACITLAAQPAPANSKLQFEAASVKPSSPLAPSGRAMAMMWRNVLPAGELPMPDPGRVHIEGWPLRLLIAAAYRVRADKVSGPAWLEDERFDVEAKLPEGAKHDEAHEMLQALLAERFGLELHREPREQSGYSLVVDKHGPKLEEYVPPPPAPTPAEPLSPEEAQQKQQTEETMKALQARLRQQMQSGDRRPGRSRTSWTGKTMGEFAERLGPMAGGPVVDETGLTGKYNFEVETWNATDDDPGQTIFEAVGKLGLKLVPRKVSVEIPVIDKISKAPSAN